MGFAFPVGLRIYVGDDPETARIGAFYGFNVAAGIAGRRRRIVLVPELGTRRS